MSFIAAPISQALSGRAQAELSSLLGQVPVIDEALDKGGWICGGFARQLLLDRPTREYFRPFTQEGLDSSPAGDVDVFFNSSDDAAAVMDRRGTRRSAAGFARELHDYVKVQLVDDPNLIKPTIEETLAGFDIVNCRVAINHRQVIVADDWREIENKRLLRIGRNNTPFLGGRLLKYLKHRGLDGLTDDSYESLTGWLAHAANDFKEGDWTERHIHGAEGHIKKLRERGLVRRDDLIFFIGKWKQVFKERSYGATRSYEVDWALNELGKNN